MAKELTTASISAPGFFGLNTQESSVTLAAGFALRADNCVIDQYGRLGARKGWSYLTTDAAVGLQGGYRFTDIDGTVTFLCWNDTGFYEYNGSSPLVSLTYSGVGTLLEGNWQGVTLNDKAYFFQRGYNPVFFDPLTGVIDDTAVTVPTGNCALAAYGRVWTADTDTNQNTVYWSTLLDGNDFTTGTAGSINLSAVLVGGNDRIVALGAQNGRLIIFCERSIVIYGDTDADQILNPVNMRLVEVISGVGCVARDSVQNTGKDIVFLSEDGLRSLGRVIQEKSQPMTDISKNIRDDLVRTVNQVDRETVKSCYSADNAFYLLLVPEYSRIYCFDMRSPLQDGSARVTLWDNQTQTNMIVGPNNLFFTQVDGLARYSGYTDNGVPYRLKYYTNYLDFDNATTVKYMKRLAVTLIGGAGQDFVFKTGYDYNDNYESYGVNIVDKANSEYGVSEYNFGAEYTTGTLSETIRAPVGGSGNIIQVGFEAEIAGIELSIQKLDIYIKQGKIY